MGLVLFDDAMTQWFEKRLHTLSHNLMADSSTLTLDRAIWALGFINPVFQNQHLGVPDSCNY